MSDVNDLPAISAKIGNDLRNEYLLGYYTAATRDGKYHKVNVNVSLPDQKLPIRPSALISGKATTRSSPTSGNRTKPADSRRANW